MRIEDMQSLGKLPTSADETTSLLVVVGVAMFAGLARILYGKNDMTLRYTVGAMLVAGTTGIIIYGAIASYFPMIGGHATAAIGAICGSFTDDILRRTRDKVRTIKLPGDSGDSEQVTPE